MLHLCFVFEKPWLMRIAIDECFNSECALIQILVVHQISVGVRTRHCLFSHEEAISCFLLKDIRWLFFIYNLVMRYNGSDLANKISDRVVLSDQVIVAESGIFGLHEHILILFSLRGDNRMMQPLLGGVHSCGRSFTSGCLFSV